MNILKRALRRWAELGTREVIHEDGTRERRPVIIRTRASSRQAAPPGTPLIASPQATASPVWASQRPPVWGMRSVSPRHYNLVNVEPGALIFPLLRPPGFPFGFAPASLYRRFLYTDGTAAPGGAQHKNHALVKDVPSGRCSALVPLHRVSPRTAKVGLCER
jgi:hypothetical protein